MDQNNWKNLLTESKKLFINEEIESDANTLVQKIKITIQKYFPKSSLSVEFTTSFYPSIDIRFHVGQSKDWPNGISHNDPAIASMTIDGFDNSGNMRKDKVVLELGRGGFLVVKPSDKPDPKLGFKLAQGRVKIPFRKTTGDMNTILKAIDTYFKRLATAIKENENNLMDQHKYAVKYVKK